MATVSAAQEEEPAESAPTLSPQVMIDTEALVIASDVTTRCALYDSSIPYLTPLEQAAASVRLEELTALAQANLDGVPDLIAQMHEEAAAIACGDEALTTYMDFGRQIARDVIDIALLAWQTIDINRCAYFADDGFMSAVEEAKARAEEIVIEGAENRVLYVERGAAAWVDLFARNCANLQFQPDLTLPGKIALALPSQ